MFDAAGGHATSLIGLNEIDVSSVEENLCDTSR
jgi:hypothetical protein